MVNPGNHIEPRIQITKKQLLWLLANTKIAEQLDVLEIKPGAYYGDYLNSYELRKLQEEKTE